MMIGSSDFFPPSEKHSASICFTSGCCGGDCTFCGRRGTSFNILTPSQARHAAFIALQNAPLARRVYFSGEDSIALPMEYLLDIIGYVKWLRPDVNAVAINAKSQSILMKSENELKRLRSAGVSVIYQNVFSGSQDVLDCAHAGVNLSEQRIAAQMVKSAGITLVQLVLSGLSSLCSETTPSKCASSTAEYINESGPDEVIIINYASSSSFAELRELAEKINISDGWLTAAGDDSDYVRIKFPQNRSFLSAMLSECASGNSMYFRGFRGSIA